MNKLLLGLLFLTGCGSDSGFTQPYVAQPYEAPQPQTNCVRCEAWRLGPCGYSVFPCSNGAIYTCLNQSQAFQLLTSGVCQGY
jgi:hypothetical protein